MADDFGTIGGIARLFVTALRPLRDAVADPDRFQALIARMGWNVSAMPPAFASLGASINAADVKLTAMPGRPSVLDQLDLASAVAQAFDAIQNINVAPPGADASFVPEFRARLFDQLLMDRLSAELPGVFNAFQALGVIKFDVAAPTATRPSFPRLTFDWGSLGALVRQPTDLVKKTFGWGTSGFDHERLTNVLAEYFFGLDFPITIDPTDEASLTAYLGGPPPVERGHTLDVPFFFINAGGQELKASFAMRGLPAAPGKLPGFVIEPRVPPQFPLRLRLSDTIDLRLRAGTNAADLFGIVVRPGEMSITYPFAPGRPPPAGGIGVGFDFTPKQPTVLLGSADGTRLEWQGASIDLGAEFSNGAWSIALGAELTGLAFVLDPGEGDGFLRFLVGDSPTTIGLPLALRWSGADGIRFGGSAGFEVVVHPHVAIGPASIDEIDFRLRAPDVATPRVDLEVGAGISGGIGPVSFALAGVGLRAEVTFEPGNIGPFDIGIGFKPPNGVGVSVDGGGFRGGGFLNLDPERGEYSGALELTFAEVVSVRAVGILSTRLPDGKDAFSLLIIIVSEFVPIQLSYGFTLLGVGGLLGLNRTIDIDALQVGVRDGTLNSILFPTDVVANASRIISDLKRVFPPHEDRFLIGPMGKLGWGTPTLMSVELGLLLEIPRPAFAILGVLRVQLPAEEFGTIYIQVNFVGSIDFEKGQLQFDASLYNSRVMISPLTGDMALRIYWGGDPNFLLSVGGFHPAYTPPPMNIGSLTRLGMVIVAGIPSVRAEVYFALTSNTVQFGALIEIMYGVKLFNVFGSVSLDVLIQFNPFKFIAEISAMFGVRAGSEVLFAIQLRGTLEGPEPWHVRGEASFEIGFIIKVRLSANFEVTAGDARDTLLPPIDVIGEIRNALDKVGNWRAVLPPASNQHVSLRDLPQSGAALVLHPFGALEISQKIAPLNIAIQRVGANRPDRGSVFRIGAVQINSADVATTTSGEEFAPAQFFDMDDAAKLSRPSFARYESGIVIGADNAPQTDFRRERDVQYEVIYLPEHHPVRLFFKLATGLFQAFARGGSAAQSTLSQQARAPSAVAAEHVSLAPEQYAVVSTLDLTLHAAPLVFASAAAADQAVARLIAGQPELVGAVQVVPSAQMRKAA